MATRVGLSSTMSIRTSRRSSLSSSASQRRSSALVISVLNKGYEGMRVEGQKRALISTLLEQDIFAYTYDISPETIRGDEREDSNIRTSPALVYDYIFVLGCDMSDPEMMTYLSWQIAYMKTDQRRVYLIGAYIGSSSSSSSSNVFVPQSASIFSLVDHYFVDSTTTSQVLETIVGPKNVSVLTELAITTISPLEQQPIRNNVGVFFFVGNEDDAKNDPLMFAGSLAEALTNPQTTMTLFSVKDFTEKVYETLINEYGVEESRVSIHKIKENVVDDPSTYANLIRANRLTHVFTNSYVIYLLAMACNVLAYAAIENMYSEEDKILLINMLNDLLNNELNALFYNEDIFGSSEEQFTSALNLFINETVHTYANSTLVRNVEMQKQEMVKMILNRKSKVSYIRYGELAPDFLTYEDKDADLPKILQCVSSIFPPLPHQDIMNWLDGKQSTLSFSGPQELNAAAMVEDLTQLLSFIGLGGGGSLQLASKYSSFFKNRLEYNAETNQIVYRSPTSTSPYQDVLLFRSQYSHESDMIELYSRRSWIYTGPPMHVEPLSLDLYTGIHRSGWNYVLSGLLTTDYRTRPIMGGIEISMTSNENILMDAYVDRTFHWGQTILKAAGKLPYTSPWVGFVHHTFDTSFSEYNCVSLFSNPVFLESLQSCRALITLSVDLQRKVKEALNEKGFGNVQVFNMLHPTEEPAVKFSMTAFRTNQNRYLVQIGSWLRNPYSIYKLVIPPSTNRWSLKKAVLKGQSMENTFPPPSFIQAIEDTAQEYAYASSSGLPAMCRNDNNSPDIPTSESTRRQRANKYVLGLLDYINKNEDSVTTIDFLDDQMYDELLSKNIVFLHLVDCSAVNTIMECIVRNTPFIVNRLPALEEILGESFPGFYSDLDNVPIMLSREDTIERIHEFLVSRTADLKVRLQLDYFMKDLQRHLLSLV